MQFSATFFHRNANFNKSGGYTMYRGDVFLSVYARIKVLRKNFHEIQICILKKPCKGDIT